MEVIQKFNAWIQNDWAFFRFRFIAETIGSLAYLSATIILAVLNTNAPVGLLLALQVIGSTCHIVNAYLRSSVNLLILNTTVLVIVVGGLINFYY